jgi:hypothetical protein
MQNSAELTAGELRKLVNYDEDTGAFTWRISRVGCAAGTKLGVVPHRNGYLRIGIMRKRYLAHRLAWLYVHGEWPPEEIDHINRDRTDNRISNLRLATRRQNSQNNSRRGIAKNGKGWMAALHVDRKRIHLGTYPSPELARSVYLKAKRYFHEYSTV